METDHQMEGTDPDSSEPGGAPTPDPPHPDEAPGETRVVTIRDFTEWRGKDLIDGTGERIGKLEDVYFDVETDQPQFGTVKEGLFGRHLTFVPLTDVIVGPNDLQIPVSRDKVKDAPHIDSEGEALTPDDESTLYHYYQLNYTPSGTPTGRRLARR
jgi:hypothetical protein